MDVQTFFSRGVAEAVVKEGLMTLLERCPRPLRIKFGLDPSSPDLTLGHFACFRKLRQLQQMGYTVVVVVGDWTARIGDPSGRRNTRRMLDPLTVKHNAESYLDELSACVLRDTQPQVTSRCRFIPNLLARFLMLTADLPVDIASLRSISSA